MIAREIFKKKLKSWNYDDNILKKVLRTYDEDQDIASEINTFINKGDDDELLEFMDELLNYIDSRTDDSASAAAPAASAEIVDPELVSINRITTKPAAVKRTGALTPLEIQVLASPEQDFPDFEYISPEAAVNFSEEQLKQITINLFGNLYHNMTPEQKKIFNGPYKNKILEIQKLFYIAVTKTQTMLEKIERNKEMFVRNSKTATLDYFLKNATKSLIKGLLKKGVSRETLKTFKGGKKSPSKKKRRGNRGKSPKKRRTKRGKSPSKKKRRGNRGKSPKKRRTKRRRRRKSRKRRSTKRRR